MLTPKVSCLMPTYNRFPNNRYRDGRWVIEESIECFQRQTFKDAELIICNDCPGQEYQLERADPRIMIWNVPRRFNSLGEKLNAMAAVAQGSLICRWDDDDIYLPHRLAVQVARYKGDHKLGYLTAGGKWFSECGGYKYERRGAFAQVMMTRDFFVNVRGFAFMGVGEDVELEGRARAQGPAVAVTLPVAPETALMIYRWGTGTEHVSGKGAAGYELMGRTPKTTGTYVLKPHWRRDYVQDIAREAANVTRATS